MSSVCVSTFGLVQWERLYDFMPGMELMPSFQLHRLLPKAPVMVIYSTTVSDYITAKTIHSLHRFEMVTWLH